MKMRPLLFTLVVVLIATACRKNSFITSGNAVVEFSSDTLYFDTVFVSTGSVTEAVKITNLNDQKLRLSTVKLMGGTQSYFHINIDGQPGPEQDNIDLDPGDSVYVFVAVEIEQGSAGLPFVVEDSIQVAFNGNTEYIQLRAWGQNAHFLQNEVITGNTMWNDSLPYVILGSLQVDTNAVLTMGPGTRVYSHADAPLLIDGALMVNGIAADSGRVYFLSDRLDQPYAGYPGSWPGIYFRGTSAGSNLQYAVISNAYQAVVVQSPPAGSVAKVSLAQCIINNSYSVGILGIGGSLQATNCLISNCGQDIALGGGGYYQFVQCTAAAYSNNLIIHSQPVLSVADIADVNGLTIAGSTQAAFVNCIFWGGNGAVSSEVVVSRQGTAAFNVGFSNCLWKVNPAPSGVSTIGMIANMDPLFDSVNNAMGYYDFHLQSGSPAVGAGLPAGIGVDLDGNTRPVNNPDLGCYQRQ
jgi:hypothetical protein